MMHSYVESDSCWRGENGHSKAIGFIGLLESGGGAAALDKNTSTSHSRQSEVEAIFFYGRTPRCGLIVGEIMTISVFSCATLAKIRHALC